MSKNKKVCRAINYFEHFLVFISAVSACVSISAFVLLVVVSVGNANSAVELKICALTAGIKKYMSIIKSKRKKDNGDVNKNQVKYY